MKSLQGRLLVASPHLPDRNFMRSVVLIIQHDNDGAFGLILNRPTNSKVSDIWEMLCEDPCPSQQVINLGGPVAGPLIAIHTEPSCSENQILPGVHLATQKQHLTQILVQQNRPVRLFTGYSGWAGGQLEAELKVGGWLTAPATAEDIFSDPETLWKKITQSIGLGVLSPTIRHRGLPEDPSLN
jgi:putative transcriptional regulator